MSSSRCSRIAPASNREISSRSSTRPWNRVTSLDRRSRAAWARSGISSRRASITSTDAASVMSGDRSSWLTSDAKRASRSTRCCSASAMSLNESVRIRRSGSSVDSSRVSSRPPAIDEAACAAVATGLTARRAAKMPRSTASSVEISAAKTSERRTLDSVASASSRFENSKYEPPPGTAQPTTMFNSSATFAIWTAETCSSITRCRRSIGTESGSPPPVHSPSYWIR